METTHIKLKTQKIIREESEIEIRFPSYWKHTKFDWLYKAVDKNRCVIIGGGPSPSAEVKTADIYLFEKISSNEVVEITELEFSEAFQKTITDLTQLAIETSQTILTPEQEIK